MTDHLEKQRGFDIRDDLNINTGKNYKKIQQKDHEFWIKIALTIIALVIVVVSFIYLLYFGISQEFRPHTVYDFPIILALSILPMTILVLLIRYFYRNENSKNADDSITMPQIEAVKSLLSIIKDIGNLK